MNKYIKEYKWSDIFKMIRNQKSEPEVCNEKYNNRLVVITGGTSGIGMATAKKYASSGADILTVNRNVEKSEKLCKQIREKYNVKCDYIIADFSSLKATKEAGIKLLEMDRDIDILIHNAGLHLSKKFLTEDGIEMIFQINYISSFILNYYLKDKFLKQNKGRIIYVNSEGHRFAPWGLDLNDLRWEKHSYTGLKSYGFAKMAQLQSMLIFNDIFKDSKVTINAMHPGNVKTNTGRDNGRIYKFFKRNFIDKTAIPMTKATEALYYLGVSEKLKSVSGMFFALTTIEKPAPPALDREAAERLWDISMKLGGLNEK